MRKFLFLIPLLLLQTLGARGQSFTNGQLKYRVNGSGTVAVLGPTASVSGLLRIPSTVTQDGTTYRVSAIRAMAFREQANLTSAVLPAELDTIGQDAFYGCARFAAMTGLKRLDVCEPYAFARTRLVSVNWAEVEVNALGVGMFEGCTFMKSVSLPQGTTLLPDAAFAGCTALTSLILDATALTAIGQRALAGCTAMKQLTLPATLQSIGEEAFAGMTALEGIGLPEGLTTVGAGAFRGCTAMESMELPASVTSVGYAPFSGCTSLREVTLPPRAAGLDEVYPFADCPALERIMVSAGSIYYKSENGVLTNLTGKKIIAWPAALSRTLRPQLEATSVPLAPGALMGCEMDSVLLLPAQTTTIAREALAGTSGLKNLQAPERSLLATIGERAFADCADLREMTLTSKVKNIGPAAFRGAKALETVCVRMATPPALPDSAFSGETYSRAVLHTLPGKAEAYRAASGWSLFQEISDDGATGIPSLSEKNVRDVVYDLQGRRVAKDKLQPGLYIVNGRKTVLK